MSWRMIDFKCAPCNVEREELVKGDKPTLCDKCGKPMSEKIGATNLGGFDRMGRSIK